MAIRKIAQMGAPVLRQVARYLEPHEIASPLVQTLIDDMIETMHDADGAGIAAPQVYESLQICIIEVQKNPRYPDFKPIPLTVLINPKVTPILNEPVEKLPDAEVISMYEGCLSVQGIRGFVRRPRRVHITALDRSGAPLSFDWEGIRAAIVQHETDHLNGILFVDRANPKTLTFIREYERHVPPERRIIDGQARVASAVTEMPE